MLPATPSFTLPALRRNWWFLTFILLGGFNVISVAAGAWLMHDTNRAFGESLTVNQKWANYLAEMSRAFALSSRVNSPGSTVFETRDPQSERRNLARAHVEFGSVFEKLKASISNDKSLDSDQAVAGLNKIEHAIDAMAATTSRVIAAVQRGDIQGAANLLSVMDRRYAEAREAFEDTRTVIRDCQLDSLESQQAIGERLRLWQNVLSTGVLVAVGFTVAFGLAMARSGERMAIERERSLRELEFQKFAVDQAAIVAVTDSRGRITYANDRFCEISGYTREELLGKDHRIVNSGHHPKKFWSDMFATTAAGKVWHGEVKNRRKDGALYWVDSTIIPCMHNNRVDRFVAIRTDITERKLTEEKLLQANAIAEAASRAKSDFLANMSHEIRTPMTAILGFTDLLRDQSCSPEQLDEYAGTIRRNGEHLLTIINDILDISKIESGKLQVESIECSPTQVIEEVTSLMRVRAAAKNVELRIDYRTDLPERVLSDPTRLRQILMNLIGNAIKFTDAGEVRLIASAQKATPSSASLTIDIIDTGLGMTGATIDRLFSPFSQADTSTTRTHGGTGLGLTISRKLARMLGGDIAVRSELGRGSTFTLALHNLPVMLFNPEAPAPTPAAPRQSPATGLRGRRILLAEDGADNRKLISFHLKRAGAEVTTAENGCSAFEQAIKLWRNRRPFDVILMDMQMPEMDGYQATSELRKMGYTGAIIALTAHAMTGDREKCIAAGCNDYATKPINPQGLIAMIVTHAQPLKVGSQAA